MSMVFSRWSSKYTICDGILSAVETGSSKATIDYFPTPTVVLVMRLALAFRAFFAVLSGKEAAQRVRVALAPAVEPQRQGTQQPTVAPTAMGARSDALTLLMVLQRDARLLDLLGESFDQYSDAQIGSAARPVLQESAKSLDRLLGLQHLTSQGEGDRVDIPQHASPVRWRLTGSASAKTGRIAHPGWQATKMELPKWTGPRDEAMILAPIEVDAGP
jgi:hypothetical protein